MPGIYILLPISGIYTSPTLGQQTIVLSRVIACYSSFWAVVLLDFQDSSLVAISFIPLYLFPVHISLDLRWSYILITHCKLKISYVKSAFNTPNLPNIA